ncbi:MAG: class III signal peptide-containing protein [Candidatus Diapherotrites archaeon]|nr:class III signal peptide-containing protein [Candidatus Diapherotrites archaeon]
MVFNLNGKGQTSIEFLFLFLIILVIIHGVVYPAFVETQNSVLGLHRIGQARLAVKQIANAVSEVASATGESQRTVWIFLDDNITLHCDETNKRIYFRVPFQSSARVTEIKEGSVTVGSGCNQASYQQGCEGGELLHFPASSSLSIECDNFKLCDSSSGNCSCNGASGDCIEGSYVKKVKVSITKHYLTTLTSTVSLQAQPPQPPGGP